MYMHPSLCSVEVKGKMEEDLLFPPRGSALLLQSRRSMLSCSVLRALPAILAIPHSLCATPCSTCASHLPCRMSARIPHSSNGSISLSSRFPCNARRGERRRGVFHSLLHR